MYIIKRAGCICECNNNKLAMRIELTIWCCVQTEEIVYIAEVMDIYKRQRAKWRLDGYVLSSDCLYVRCTGSCVCLHFLVLGHSLHLHLVFICIYRNICVSVCIWIKRGLNFCESIVWNIIGHVRRVGCTLVFNNKIILETRLSLRWIVREKARAYMYIFIYLFLLNAPLDSWTIFKGQRYWRSTVKRRQNMFIYTFTIYILDICYIYICMYTPTVYMYMGFWFKLFTSVGISV